VPSCFLKTAGFHLTIINHTHEGRGEVPRTKFFVERMMEQVKRYAKIWLFRARPTAAEMDTKWLKIFTYTV
jgi:hypothetical protein